MTGAQFEIRIDGTPRSYRDRKDYAMEAARFIKSKNPNSVVEVKDLQSGALAVIAHAALRNVPAQCDQLCTDAGGLVRVS
jgi:hypothetical protein